MSQVSFVTADLAACELRIWNKDDEPNEKAIYYDDEDWRSNGTPYRLDEPTTEGKLARIRDVFAHYAKEGVDVFMTNGPLPEVALTRRVISNMETLRPKLRGEREKMFLQALIANAKKPAPTDTQPPGPPAPPPRPTRNKVANLRTPVSLIKWEDQKPHSRLELTKYQHAGDLPNIRWKECVNSGIKFRSYIKERFPANKSTLAPNPADVVQLTDILTNVKSEDLRKEAFEYCPLWLQLFVLEQMYVRIDGKIEEFTQIFIVKASDAPVLKECIVLKEYIAKHLDDPKLGAFYTNLHTKLP